MPRLSDSMEEGTVAKWLVDVGAEVAKGQALVEIDTDKATMEYEAEVAGGMGDGAAPDGAAAGRAGDGASSPPFEIRLPSDPVQRSVDRKVIRLASGVTWERLTTASIANARSAFARSEWLTRSGEAGRAHRNVPDSMRS